MSATGMIRVVTERGGSKPYTVTDWARRAVKPLIAAGRCERRHLEERGQALTPADVQSALLLSLSLPRL
jgi:hypothetical protein